MKAGPAKSYKRVKKEDKNKKKLKTALKNVATKTPLPKGQNLTDTNFKVKKIVIKDQVKPHGLDEIVYHKKLNLNELIVRLSHHNSSIKTEALDGLKDLISSYPEDVLSQNHVQILDAVVKLVLDETATIRKSSTKIVSMILSAIPPHKLAPLHASLNSYMLCGLTHIDRGIREDSLSLMDACLLHAPELCEKYAYSLLTVCLDLISNQSVSSRTLSLNLESAQVASKWRTKVLERMKGLLHCLLNRSSKSSGFGEKMDGVERIFKPGSPNHFPVYAAIPSLADSPEAQNPQDNFYKHSAADFAEVIIPLLLDMFLEVHPVEKSAIETNLSTAISEEACKLLGLIVDIMLTSWNIMENNKETDRCQVLTQKFARPLLEALIVGRFPYSLNFRTAGNSKRVSLSSDNALTLNLSAARLVLVFTEHSQWYNVVPFLKNCFRNSDQFSHSDTATFASCIRRICEEKQFPEKDYFFSRVVQILLDVKSPLCPHLFRLLGDVALTDKMQHFHGHPDFEKWLASLPECVAKEKILPHQLAVISKIAVRQFPSFSDSLDVNIECILDNIPKVSVVDDSKRDSVQWEMATLLHWVREWDEELTESLRPAIENIYWGERLTKYISEIISIKDARERM